MKENKASEKMKRFVKKIWGDFTEWFTDKEHPNSRLKKTIFFHDALKIVGLILVFLIMYSNLNKINQIVLIFIKIGSLLQLVLLFFILRKAWHLSINLKYFFRGLNNGTKAIIALAIVILLFVAFVNQEKVVNSVTETYEKTNFSRINPVYIPSNFSLFGSGGNSSIKRSSSNYEDPLITKCKASYNSCKEISTKKYDVSITLLKVKKVENKSSAEEFYNSWKGPLQSIQLDWELGYYSNYYKYEFPMVFLAITARGQAGQIPAVLFCDRSGNLIEDSKSHLLCG